MFFHRSQICRPFIVAVVAAIAMGDGATHGQTLAAPRNLSDRNPAARNPATRRQTITAPVPADSKAAQRWLGDGWVGDLPPEPGISDPPLASGSNVEHYQAVLQPWRRVRVAAGDMGILASVSVSIGQTVRQGETVAQLRDEVLRASLASADAAASAEGLIEAARLDLQSRQEQLDACNGLCDSGDVSDLELRRLRRSVQTARANLDTAIENRIVKRLDVRRIEAQLANRSITSPIDGVVVEVVKHAGEFVSPTDPVIVHLADVSQLRATFQLPIDVASNLRAGQEVTVNVDGRSLRCNVQAIVPMMDPGSQRVAVEVVLPKIETEPATEAPEQTFLPGQTATWRLPHHPAVARRP